MSKAKGPKLPGIEERSSLFKGSRPDVQGIKTLDVTDPIFKAAGPNLPDMDTQSAKHREAIFSLGEGCPEVVCELIVSCTNMKLCARQ